MPSPPTRWKTTSKNYWGDAEMNDKHYISICACNKATDARKIDLFQWITLSALPKFAADNKNDSMMIYAGYNETKDVYPRLESSVDRFSTILIDCDNPSSDPHIIEKFKERMSEWDYMLYETASSTPERPKFRAIVPMDDVLTWSPYMKKAVFNEFNEFADERASWFYTPTKDKLNTICENRTGKWYSSKAIIEIANRLEKEDKMRRDREMLLAMKWRLRHPEGFQQKAGSWRNLPSVKHCLEGLYVGERDDSLCKACYAMNKNGYRANIPEFLDECDVPSEMKAKWRGRYR